MGKFTRKSFGSPEKDTSAQVLPTVIRPPQILADRWFSCVATARWHLESGALTVNCQFEGVMLGPTFSKNPLRPGQQRRRGQSTSWLILQVVSSSCNRVRMHPTLRIAMMSSLRWLGKGQEQSGIQRQ